MDALTFDQVDDILAQPATDTGANEQAEGALRGSLTAIGKAVGHDALAAMLIPWFEKLEPELRAAGNPNHPALVALDRHRQTRGTR